MVGEYLRSRTYQGLDPRYGMDEPSTLEQGRRGIPRGYDTDIPPPPPQVELEKSTTTEEQTDENNSSEERK